MVRYTIHFYETELNIDELLVRTNNSLKSLSFFVSFFLCFFLCVFLSFFLSFSVFHALSLLVSSTYGFTNVGLCLLSRVLYCNAFFFSLFLSLCLSLSLSVSVYLSVTYFLSFSLFLCLRNCPHVYLTHSIHLCFLFSNYLCFFCFYSLCDCNSAPCSSFFSLSVSLFSLSCVVLSLFFVYFWCVCAFMCVLYINI